MLFYPKIYCYLTTAATPRRNMCLDEYGLENKRAMRPGSEIPEKGMQMMG